MSLLSQEIENQQITSLKYTVVLPRLRQNERNMVFGMLVAGTSENELQVCFVVFVFLFITSWDGATRQETLLTHPDRYDVRQGRRDRTVKLLSWKYASDSSRYL